MGIILFRHWKKMFGSLVIFIFLFILSTGCGHGTADSGNNNLIQQDEMHNNEDIQPEDFSQFIERFHYFNSKDCLNLWCYLIPK